jgi:hypothetical protein
MMSDIEKKIGDLLIQGEEIDTIVSKLIKDAETQQIQSDMHYENNVPNFFDEESNDSTWNPTCTYQLKSPDEEFDKFQIQIVKEYELWCNESENVINSFLPDKSEEFRCFKIGNSSEYGILPILKFLKIYDILPEKRDIIRDFRFKFNAQKNILSGLARTIHLFPNKKNEPTERSMMTNIPPKFPTIININQQTQTQTVSVDISIQKFKDLRSIIQDSEESKELKKKLLSQVDALEKYKGTSKYVESFQNFMDVAANSATLMSALRPIFPYLTSLLQS